MVTSSLYSGFSASGINFDRYEGIPVEVSGRATQQLHQLTAFSEIDLHPILANSVRLLHYDRPTPVQKHAMPIVLAGRDLMACAETGAVPGHSSSLAFGFSRCPPPPSLLHLLSTRNNSIK